MTGIVSVIVAIVLAIVLGWVTTRAWRLRNMALKIAASVVSGLLTLVLALVSIVGLAGVCRLALRLGTLVAPNSLQVGHSKTGPTARSSAPSAREWIAMGTH